MSTLELSGGHILLTYTWHHHHTKKHYILGNSRSTPVLSYLESISTRWHCIKLTYNAHFATYLDNELMNKKFKKVLNLQRYTVCILHQHKEQNIHFLIPSQRGFGACIIHFNWLDIGDSHQAAALPHLGLLKQTTCGDTWFFVRRLYHFLLWC